jgi:membrane-associated protease RseP (regulator of RpoE activity)
MNETLLYILGIVIMIVGLALSIGLHEFGHLIPAKLFGVRVPHWAIGFGPKLWAKKFGETEYSVRLIPLGGFITLIGMFPPAKPGKDDSKRWFSNAITSAREAHSEHVQPGDEGRMLYQLPAYKRIIVMAGGPLTNLLLGIILITTALSVIGPNARVAKIDSVVECVEQMAMAVEVCSADSEPTPAVVAGLRADDVVTAVNGDAVSFNSDPFVQVIAEPNRAHTLTVARDGETVQLSIKAARADLPFADATGAMAIDEAGKPLLRERVYVGVRFAVDHQPLAVANSASAAINMTNETLGFIVQFPVQVFESVSSLFTGAERSANSAVSILGITQFAGEVTSSSEADLADRVFTNLMLLGSLNLALFAFNMIPLPPLDGGHIAGGLYEYLKRGLYRAMGKPDPGYADTALMAPVANFMFLVLLLAGLAMILVDIFNPLNIG